MRRSRIQGSSTDYGGSECGREALIMMRPSWGFAPWRKKEKYMGFPTQLLDGPGSNHGGARFSAPVQTGPEAHPVYRFFSGSKERQGRDADPSPPSSAVVMKE